MQNRMKSILIVDDEEGLTRGLKQLFERNGYTVFTSYNYNGALAVLEKEHINAAIMDIRLGKHSGLDLLEKVKQSDPDIVPIMITGYGSIDSAVEAMKQGAADYIIKPVDNAYILNVVNKQLDIVTLRTENSYLKKELNRSQKSFILESPEMKRLHDTIDKVKDTDASILITGESGTGKEILAHHIHSSSNRKDNNIVCINCAALSETLLLSELFGHEKGAFTGAVERKIGKFEIAHEGTLFLDEIGDMSMDTQARLLRVLEDKKFERIGSNKKISTNVRLISATNKDIPKLIDEGLFRKDLYYRVNVISLKIPPLRSRKEEVLPLSRFFVDEFSRRYGKDLSQITESGVRLLHRHDWPGNIRELKNVINQAVLLSDGPTLSDTVLASLLKSCGEEKSDEPFSDLKSEVEKVTARYEKEIIHEFLLKNDFNKSRTAEALGVTRKTLFDKIKRYELE